jgi:CRP-like cAMP-binding protein
MNVLELFQDWQEVREFDASATVFREQEPAGALYVVLSGEIELSVQGNRLSAESAGGIIGEMTMIEGAVHSSTATAVVPSRLALLNLDQFGTLVHENPGFSMHAMALLANRLRAVDQFIAAINGTG